MTKVACCTVSNQFDMGFEGEVDIDFVVIRFLTCYNRDHGLFFRCIMPVFSTGLSWIKCFLYAGLSGRHSQMYIMLEPLTFVYVSIQIGFRKLEKTNQFL